MRPLTCNTPKMMVPVLNRPYLEHLVEYLKKHDVIDIVLAIGRLPDQVRDYLGGSELGVSITYSTEDSPLGTAGAVRNAERFLDGPFLVFNGDIFTDIDLSAMMRYHGRNKAIATLALTAVEDPTIYGVVETDSRGRVTRFTEKPRREEVTTNMINAGIYILELDALSYVGRHAFSMFERDVFPLLLDKGEAVFGYASRDYWIDIGTPDKYLRLQHDLLRHRAGDRQAGFDGQYSVHASAHIEGPALIGEGCFIDRDCVVRGPAVLGAGCHVEEGATIEGAVLWQKCTIGRGARLRNCLLGSNCCIAEESEVLDGCVLGDDVQIGKGNRLCNGIRVWPGRTIEAGTISF